MLMNSGHPCLFQKGFCTVYFGAQKKNAVTIPHSAQRKHAFIGKIQVCPELINVMIENNLSHKSGAKSTLYNVAMKVFPLLLHICIRT